MGRMIRAIGGWAGLTLAAGAFLSVAGGGVASASIGGAWTQQTLPPGFTVSTSGGSGPPLNPVACAAGTSFCIAVTADINVQHDDIIGQADVVTTNGVDWTGYTDLPSSLGHVTGLSCPTASDCWLSGISQDNTAVLAQSTDGGQTWTDETPSAFTAAGWWSDAIDCPDTTTCWVVGQSGTNDTTPVAAVTTDGGADWSTLGNLPSITPYDPNGTFELDSISCVSDLSCVAVGGLDYADGVAQVISTTDGGASWSLSTDPALQGVQELFGVSCNGSAVAPDCTAVGASLEAAGPVELSSTDGGLTWSGGELDEGNGWLDSVSCSSATNCWASGAGTTTALLGTPNGGSTWSVQTGSTSNEDGSVACASATYCVATNDSGLYTTTDDGDMAANTAFVTEKAAVAQRFPRASAATISARSGRTATVIGQDRAGTKGTPYTASIQSPDGLGATGGTLGLNDFYSVPVSGLPVGITRVAISVDNKVIRRFAVHAYKDAAPVVRSVGPAAGPMRGGTRVLIKGTGFTGATSVQFGSKSGSGLRRTSATELSVVTPAGIGVEPVTVSTPGGGPSALSRVARYSYAAPLSGLRLSSAKGSSRGGQTVRITGTGVAWTTGVSFGSRAASHLRLLSARTLSVRVPKGEGTVTVTVRASGGTSRTLHYRYTKT